MAEKPTLKLYNTLTRQKEAFVPEDPQNVRMYVCGPTVYDYAHIGNARPVIVFDVLFRLLRHIYGPEHVTYVRNITDVDDKINARAAKEGVDIRALTEQTAKQFHKDVAALGCLPPTVEPRATDHIYEMIAMIQALLDKKHAYIAEGTEGTEILFDTASMPDYGQLSNRRLEDQIEGARVAVEAHKRHAADFVLWKQSRGSDPGWDATFKLGRRKVTIFGRPGWHIECSAMSEKYLGKTFDIHAGGIDLVFPHHENEIAQSRCAHDTPVMARTWLHNGFLQVEGQKMSKSLGNFITIHQLLETTEFGGRKWPGEVIRLAMLKTHYRQPIDWTTRALEEAEANLNKWAAEAYHGNAAIDDADLVPVLAHLRDDVNTPLAIAAIHQIRSASAHARALMMLGIDMQRYRTQVAQAETAVDDDMRAFIGEQILARLAARKAKNWAEADRIRDELAAQGIQLKDSKDPATGEIVTTWEVTG